MHVQVLSGQMKNDEARKVFRKHNTEDFTAIRGYADNYITANMNGEKSTTAIVRNAAKEFIEKELNGQLTDKEIKASTLSTFNNQSFLSSNVTVLRVQAVNGWLSKGKTAGQRGAKKKEPLTADQLKDPDILAKTMKQVLKVVGKITGVKRTFTQAMNDTNQLQFEQRLVEFLEEKGINMEEDDDEEA